MSGLYKSWEQAKDARILKGSSRQPISYVAGHVLIFWSVYLGFYISDSCKAGTSLSKVNWTWLHPEVITWNIFTGRRDDDCQPTYIWRNSPLFLAVSHMELFPALNANYGGSQQRNKQAEWKPVVQHDDSCPKPQLAQQLSLPQSGLGLQPTCFNRAGQRTWFGRMTQTAWFQESHLAYNF